MHVRATPKPFGGFEIEGAKRPKLLAWEIAPFTLSRTKQEVFKNLPRISSQRSTVRLSDKGYREYAKLRKQMFVELDALDGGTKVLPIINNLSRTTRIRQYVIDPGLLGAREKSVKYEQALELLDMIDAPTVIFTEFKQALLGLSAFLRKKNKSLRVDHIHGGMQKKISEKKRRFLNGDTDALIVVAKAGDTALNLGGYGYLIHLDLPFTPRDYEQRQGRVDRPREHTGELVPTTEYRIIAKDTYEERMEARLVKRHATFQGVFTVKDLRELFE
jgi:SNF2 family DNA or RNA helicase